MFGGNSTLFDTQDSSKTKCVFFKRMRAHVCVDEARLWFCIVRTEQRDYDPPSFIFYMWAIGTESMWAVNSFEAQLLRAIQQSHLWLYKDHMWGVRCLSSIRTHFRSARGCRRWNTFLCTAILCLHVQIKAIFQMWRLRTQQRQEYEYLHVNQHILDKPESYATRSVMSVAGRIVLVVFFNHLIQENTLFMDFCVILWWQHLLSFSWSTMEDESTRKIASRSWSTHTSATAINQGISRKCCKRKRKNK